ncbi:cupin domain-containing protein [Tabrizicola sp.]|uniref:(R)-mandelonitrile lyase n=1 Tax=Tabrizicola sp. TaxID=2005166 RepID=UPI0035AE1384
MELHRKGSRPAVPGNAQWFTGSICMEPVIGAEPPGRPGSAIVTFQPGARTNWHTHPLGQLLIVTEGRGRAQSAGGSVIELLPGDVVWFAAGERHWHGAAPDAAMTHIAVHAALNGSTVDWDGPVTDADYLTAPEPSGS